MLGGCVLDAEDACHFAAERLKQAGFVLAYVSRRSEATYYRWPGREGVLRVAAHSAKRGRRLAGSDMPVWSCCTFGTNQGSFSEEQAEYRVAQAVGKYFLAETRRGNAERLGGAATAEHLREAVRRVA